MFDLQSKKTYNQCGVILGIIVIIIGLLFCFNPADTSATSYAESATFGGDYQTYEYEATRYAANNAADIAYNVGELGSMLALYVGLGYVVAGLLIVLHYAKLLLVVEAENKQESSKIDKVAEAPVVQEDENCIKDLEQANNET